MIAGIFHKGSGLGNQLHRYVATRVLALDKGVPFSMIAPENFKGNSFMNLDLGIQPSDLYHTDPRSGKVTPESDLPLWEEKTNYYNPEFNFIEDNTIIDGEFQDERYFEHRLDDFSIDKWLRVEYLHVPIDTCVIGFRGGEYYLYPELGLPKEYFDKGIEYMKKLNPHMNFEVHTDDPTLAKKFFPDFTIISDIKKNWLSMRWANYAIIANSSFYILPRLLKSDTTVAPRYWARRNTKEWSMPQNYYKRFIYV